jgi:hypothetical protein
MHHAVRIQEVGYSQHSLFRALLFQVEVETLMMKEQPAVNAA